MADIHLTAPTRFFELEDTGFGYRRWGNATSGQSPLFYLQHFRRGLNHWDSWMTDGLARGREMILYDPRGYASSTGAPRDLIEDMADDAARAIRALGLASVDVIGFSMYSMIAQELTRAILTWCTD